MRPTTTPAWEVGITAATVERAQRTGVPQSTWPFGTPAAWADTIPGRTPRRDFTPPSVYVTGGETQTEENRRLDQSSWFGSYGRIGIQEQMLRSWSVAYSSSLAWALSTLSREWTITPNGTDKKALTIAAFVQTLIEDHFRGNGGGWIGFLSPWAAVPIRGFALGQPYYPFDPSLTVKDEDGNVVLQGAHTLQIASIPTWNVQNWLPQEARDGTTRWGAEIYNVGGDRDPSRPTKGGNVSINADQLVHARFMPTTEDPAPYGLLRPAWVLWLQWETLVKLQTNGWQKATFGIPEIVTDATANEADLSTVNRIVSNLRAGAMVRFSLPQGYSVKWHEVPFRAGDIDKTIAALKLDALAGMFTQHIATGSSNGTQALHGSQKAEFHALARVNALTIVQAMSKGPTETAPIKKVVAMNFGADAPMPTLTFGPPPIANPQEYVKGIQAAVTAGVLTPDMTIEESVRALLDLGEMPQEIADAWAAKVKAPEVTSAPPEINTPEKPDPKPPKGKSPEVDAGGEGAEEAEEDGDPVAAAEVVALRENVMDRVLNDRMTCGPKGRAVRPCESVVSFAETVGQTSAGKDQVANILTTWREETAPVYADLLEANANSLGDVATIAVPRTADLIARLKPALRQTYRAGRVSVENEAERLEADPELAREVAEGTATTGQGGDIDRALSECSCSPIELLDARSLSERMADDVFALALPPSKRKVKAPTPAPGQPEQDVDDIDPEDSIDSIARTTAGAMAARLRNSAQNNLQSSGNGGALPATGIAAIVTDAILSLTPGVERNQAQSDVNTIFGLGRQQQQQAEGAQTFMFSNLLESETCEPCAAFDGTVFGPDQLGFFATPFSLCEGGDKCGCMVLGLGPGAIDALDDA